MYQSVDNSDENHEDFRSFGGRGGGGNVNIGGGRGHISSPPSRGNSGSALGKFNSRNINNMQSGNFNRNLNNIDRQRVFDNGSKLKMDNSIVNKNIENNKLSMLNKTNRQIPNKISKFKPNKDVDSNNIDNVSKHVPPNTIYKNDNEINKYYQHNRRLNNYYNKNYINDANYNNNWNYYPYRFYNGYAIPYWYYSNYPTYYYPFYYSMYNYLYDQYSNDTSSEFNKELIDTYIKQKVDNILNEILSEKISIETQNEIEQFTTFNNLKCNTYYYFDIIMTFIILFILIMLLTYKN
jgi:hypothetical protein